jgi:hypothetical protein
MLQPLGDGRYAKSAKRNSREGQEPKWPKQPTLLSIPLPITLPETEKIDSILLSKQMIGESIDSRVALKNALHVAGLLA